MPGLLARLKGCFTESTEKRREFQQWLEDAEAMTNRIADVDSEISITIADPSVHDTPLIGISPGFTQLTGYSAKEILGRNCRFLIDSVPDHHRTLPSERDKARVFSQTCRAVALRQQQGGDPEPGPENCCCIQLNRRKDDSFFWNMFLMHFCRIDGKPYMVALQHKLSDVEVWGGDEALTAQAAELRRRLELALSRLEVEEECDPSKASSADDTRLHFPKELYAAHVERFCESLPT